jgi:hypothetical protein
MERSIHSSYPPLLPKNDSFILLSEKKSKKMKKNIIQEKRLKYFVLKEKEGDTGVFNNFEL